MIATNLCLRFCDYPQVIGFQLAQGSRLSQVQILSHQSKIATKVELYVGLGPSYAEANFTRLGYVEFTVQLCNSCSLIVSISSAIYPWITTREVRTK